MATAAAYSGRLSGHETFVCRYAWLPKIVLELDHSLDLPLLINHKGKAETTPGESRLEGMVPRALFDAFYSKGEPLDGELLGDVSGIRGALGLFLHEDQWKEAETAAAAIRDDLEMAA